MSRPLRPGDEVWVRGRVAHVDPGMEVAYPVVTVEFESAHLHGDHTNPPIQVRPIDVALLTDLEPV